MVNYGQNTEGASALNKSTMKKLILLITYAVLLIAVIVKLDAVGLWAGKVLGAFTPLFIGFAIAFILHRPCCFFARLYGKGLKGKGARLTRPLAVATAYLIFLAILTAIMALVIPELVRSIQSFVAGIGDYGAGLQHIYDKLVAALDLELLKGMNLSARLHDAVGNILTKVLTTITSTLPQLISATGAILSAVVTGLLALVFSIYMLVGADRLTAQCRRLVVTYLPEKVSGPVLTVTRLTADTFTRYVSGQLTEAIILGCLCFLGMNIFHFSYAPLISVIIAVSALIPVAGAYIGAITAAILLLMISPMQALWFLVFLIILQQLEGNLIYPRVVGTSIGLPGIWVLAAVTVGSALMGFVGLVVGVPITAVIYTLLRRDLLRREGLPPEDGPKA